MNIDLGTFTFDTAAIQRSLDETKKKMFELKQEQSLLTNSKRELEKAIKAEIEIQKTLIKTGETQSKEYKKAEKNISDLNKKKEELFNKELKTKDALKDVNKEYRETAKAAKAFSDAEGNLIDSSQALSAAIDKENRSISDARESNKELLNLRNQLDLSTDEGVESMERLNTKLDENNQFIKENVSGYEQQKINIGDYEGALDRAGVTQRLFGVGLSDIRDTLNQAAPAYNFVKKQLVEVRTAYITATAGTAGYTTAQKAAATASALTSAALKVLRIALISTGIGAIVVAFGSFIAYLASTQEGINKVNMVLTPLKEAFKALFGSVQELGAAMGKLFSGDFSGFLSDIKEIGAKMGSNIKEAIERGKEIERIQQNLNRNEADYITLQAQLRKEFEEQKKLSDDTTKSTAEREAAAVKAIQLQKQISQGSIERIKQEAEILRLKQMSNDTSDAERAQLATKLAEIDKALEEEAAKTTEAQNKLNSIRKEGNDKAIALIQERQDAAISANEKELQLYLSQQGFRKKDAEQQLEIARQTKNKELEILEQKLKFKKISETEYQAELLDIQNTFLELQRDLVIENAERERELLLEQIANRKTDYEDFTQDRLEFEIQNSQDILKENERLAEIKLEEGSTTEREYQDQLLKIKEEARIREEEARLTFEDADNERRLIDLENQRILEDQKITDDFERRALRLETQRLQEIEAAEKTGANITLINEKYANAQLQIEQEKEMAKQQMAADTFGAISAILGKETEAGKAFALAQALINTYQGITAGVALGFPAAIPAVAAATATGFGAVKNIISVKPKAERGYVSDGNGTVLKGARHSGGGIQIEAEDGEPILTRKAYQMFPDLISQINIAGGGIPLAARGMVAGKASNNPMIQNKLMQQLDMSALSETISEGVRLGALEGSATGSMKGSQQGIIGLSDNRQIQRDSAF